MARGECLTHNAAVVYVYTLVCQCGQSLVTLVEHRDSKAVAQLRTLSRICNDLHLALIYNGRELALHAGVKNLADMFQTEACLIGLLADTDTDHVTLSCMHHTFHAVQIRMEFTLKYRLEIALHGFSGYLYDIGNALLASLRHLIDVRTDQLNLVILYLSSVLGQYQLEAVHTGAVELYLHIAAADDLALECGSESNRNVDLCDFQLDIACLKGGSVELAYVLLYDQALRYAEGLLVCDYREAKSNSTCAAGYDYVIQRSKCVYECRYTLHGVLHQSGCIARLDVSEDQSRADCYGNCVNHSCHVFSKRDYTYIRAHLQALLHTLVDDAAHQSYQDALSLIGFYKLHAFLSSGSRTQDYSYARDIAGYQRHAQLTDRCVRKMSGFGSRVGSCSVHVFQDLNELCAQSSRDTAHKRVVQSLLSCHQALHNPESFLQFSKVCHFCASHCVIAGKAVSSIREGYRFVGAVRRNRVVNGLLCQAIYCIISTENYIK